MTKVVQFNNERITIGTKSDLTKLAIKHAAIAADTDDLSKGIVKIEQMAGGNLNLHNWPPAISDLQKKFNAFKAKYNKQHPKFISSIHETFIKPLDNIEEIVHETQKQFSSIGENFEFVEKFVKLALVELNKSKQDASTFEKAVGHLVTAGTTFRGASQTLMILGDQFDVKPLKDAYKLAKQHEDTFSKANKILELARKSNRFDIDLQPVIRDLQFVPTIIQFVHRASAG